MTVAAGFWRGIKGFFKIPYSYTGGDEKVWEPLRILNKRKTTATCKLTVTETENYDTEN